MCRTHIAQMREQRHNSKVSTFQEAPKELSISLIFTYFNVVEIRKYNGGGPSGGGHF